MHGSIMLELTVDNAVAFLRDRGWVGDGAVKIEPLGGGVSNQVLRVVTDTATFVVKQSRPQLRTRDAWYSDLDRIYREYEVMRSLGPLLMGAVPEVLFVDRENYVYAMSHAPMEARSWKADLLAGNIDLAIAERAGGVLQTIHWISAQNADFRTQFSDLTVYKQLRIDPFYERVRERRPEVAAPVAVIIDQMLNVKEALCHGDYTPKNFLVHGSRFTLVDYETAHFGDPTMDLGLFLAHVTLKAARLPVRRHDYSRLMRSFWKGYTQHGNYRSPEELERRGVQHLGVCLLARIDGTSPVEYLPEEAKRDAVRRLGRSILLDGIARWGDAWACADSELAGCTTTD
jgi:aminoglycoside phosphotransferase (APT) family kinase protein